VVTSGVVVFVLGVAGCLESVGQFSFSFVSGF
jgi:hypothetical protein